jgi:heme exporter protein C
MRADARTPLIMGAMAAGDRRTVGWLAAGLSAAGLVVGLVIAPSDAVQGDAQRLMYLHVPAAWTAFVAFAVVFVASGAYLVWRDLRWDRCAQAGAEIGVGLTALTIALGSVWGRATWGAWWAWDPRLVSTALLLVVYCGYLAARHVGRGGPWAGDGTAEPAGERVRSAVAHRTAKRTAVLGIAGFPLVPVVHFSVVWWRSLHQPATVLAPDRPPIDLLMGVALLLCVAAFTTCAAWVFLRRLTILEDGAGRSAEPLAAQPPAGHLRGDLRPGAR